MTDLAEDFAAMAAQVTPRHDAVLASLGVPLDWVQGATAPARYGVTRAHLARRDRTWEPHPEGEPVCVVPDQVLPDCTDPLWGTAAFEPVDLIAFQPRDPSAWWRRRGEAVLINPEAVDRATILDKPLPVWADPLAWMQARGQGVVIVDWGRRPLRFHLAGPPSLVCQTYELAARLDRRFKSERRKDSVPRLTISEEGVAA